MESRSDAGRTPAGKPPCTFVSRSRSVRCDPGKSLEAMGSRLLPPCPFTRQIIAQPMLFPPFRIGGALALRAPGEVGDGAATAISDPEPARDARAPAIRG